jgi:alanyl-tRNA synthetase
MKGNYPELVRAESLIKETLKMEEEKFLVLLDRGIKILNEEISKIDKILPGEVAFKLYDTYGFPLDLTEDILRNKSMSIDSEKFQSLMKESRELAKKNWKGSGDAAVEDVWFGIKDKLGSTEFLGYETNQAEGTVLSLLKDNEEVDKLSNGDEGMIIVNQTPFYGESGGQVGDTGTIIGNDFKFEVTDVQKKLGDLFVHYGKVVNGSIKLKDNVELKINIERRDDTRAYHSATHLLHESLRRVLGKHVTQKGSLVEPSRLRFDFSHMKPIQTEEIDKIEDFVNNMVSKKSDVKTRLMTPDEAVENGALALFGEKYGEEVRVLSMGDDDGSYFSTELCGGTHVRNTGDIGKFKIVSQSSIAAGVRRIEALRDKQLEDYLNNKEKLSNISSEKNDQIINNLSEQITELGGKPSLDDSDQKILIKNLTKQLETISVNSILENKTKNIIKDEKINGIKIRFQNVDGLPTKELRKLVDKGKKELSEGIVIVFAAKDDKVGIAVGVTDTLTNKFDAVKFVKTGSEIIGGQGGGGRKDFAQAGGQDKSKIDEAFEKLKTLI